MQKQYMLTAMAAGLAFSLQVCAYPVEVTDSTPIREQVMPALKAINATLGEILTTDSEIGTAIVQANDKTVTAVTESAKAQRESDIFGRETERLEQARQQFQVPDSICSESASGAAAQVGQQSRASASRLAGGGGIQSTAVSKAVASLPVSAQQGGFRSAALHAAYCTAEEARLYGGTNVCPGVSSLPGGDIELSSLLDGAGEVGKVPDLTFTQDQVDAAMAYMKNSVRHDVARTPAKGDLQSASGNEYQGLMTQYKSIQSAASQPQLDIIAASQVNPATREVLAETLESKSASAYFKKTASAEAQRTGEMSEREFEAFEVGRRYANTDYETDLQAMSGDNLIRELVRTQSLGNWLQLGIRNELRTANIIAGQRLSLAADEKYGPQLQVLSSKMTEGVINNGK